MRSALVSHVATFALLASFESVALDSLGPPFELEASMIAFQLIPFRSISTTAALRLVSSGLPLYRPSPLARSIPWA